MTFCLSVCICCVSSIIIVSHIRGVFQAKCVGMSFYSGCGFLKILIKEKSVNLNLLKIHISSIFKKSNQPLFLV